MILLFLDIAFDGVIVYDRGFIGPLVEEAKRYVVERGIERISTLGWRFPVSYRQDF